MFPLITSLIWLAFLTDIVLGNEYIAVSQLKNGTEAQKYCQSTFGTNLATIPDAFENHQVYCAAQHTNLSNVWIGLQYNRSQNDYIWNDDIPNSTFQNWKKGAPSTSNAEYQRCVELVVDGYWNDVCCNKTNEFVCNGGISTTVICFFLVCYFKQSY